MTGVFLAVLNMSVTACYAALAVLLLRLMLLRAPRVFSYALWSAVLFRLVCPVSPRSVLSLIPRKAAVASAAQGASAYGGMDYFGAVSAAFPQLSRSVYAAGGVNAAGANAAGGVAAGESAATGASASAGAGFAAAGAAAARPSLLSVAAALWLAGICVMLLIGLISCVRLRQRIFGATRVAQNIYEADAIGTPFVFGFFRPKIFLPAGLGASEAGYVLAHEKTHIRRRDHLVKPVAYAALALHWFNPVIWLCYFLMVKDMEMSCDESVLRHAGGDIRKAYSSSLLSLSIRRSGLAGALTFGESSTKSRVRHALFYKKPAFWGVAAAVVIVAAAVAGLSLNPRAGLPGSKKPDGIVYRNTQYGFTFRLPADWKGYRVLADRWSASGEAGPIVKIRSPKWTQKNPYEDIEIMVINYNQWSDVIRSKLVFNGQSSAGPVEFDRNSNYVFTQVPGWDITNYPGAEELRTLFQSRPLTAYNGSAAGALSYRNTKYGFTFDLPLSWKGYTVLETKWSTGTGQNAQSGPVVKIRDPRWTAAKPYEDIKITVFTHSQWEQAANGSLRLNGAPFNPTKLGKNNRYVFVLEPRWEFDCYDGVLELEQLLKSQPLHPFDLKK